MENIKPDIYKVVLYGWGAGEPSFFASYPTRDQLTSLLLINLSDLLSNLTCLLKDISLDYDNDDHPIIHFRNTIHTGAFGKEEKFLAISSITGITFPSCKLENHLTSEHSEIRKIVKGLK